jgi:DnaJ-class molecular chaperone
MTFADLQEARQILEVGERATLGEIKARHKALVKRHHPDAGNASDPEVIRKVNAAYRLLLDYVTAYRFSFAESEFYEQNPEARLRMQFADDPVWGGG